MVGGGGIDIPVGVDAIGVNSRYSQKFIFVGVAHIKMLVAAQYHVVSPIAKLAHRTRAKGVEVATVVATEAIRAPATMASRVASATARTIRVTTATIGTTTAATRHATCGGIVQHDLLVFFLCSNTCFCCEQLRIRAVDGDGVRATTRVFDEQVEVRIKAGKDIGDHVIIVELLARYQKGINGADHLLEISDTRHVAFASRGKLGTKVHDLGT